MKTETLERANELNMEMMHIQCSIDEIMGAMPEICKQDVVRVSFGIILLDIPTSQAKEIIEARLDAYVSEYSRLEEEFNAL